MSGHVIPFPGVDPASIRPKPTCVSDLRDGENALVIVPDVSGFAVEVRPGEPDFNRRATFATHPEALRFARRTSASSPRYYPLILDETPQGRDSLERVIGLGPDPMGVRHLPDNRGKGRF